MGLEELLWLAVRLLGWHVVHQALSRLVAGAQNGESESEPRCVQRFQDAFDCDELGIYEEE